MTLTDNKKFMLIFIGCIIIAAAIIIFSFFGKGRNNDKYVDLALKAYQQAVDMAKEQRPIFEKQIQDLKLEIAEHRKIDSLLIIKINSNNQSIRIVDDRIKNIPASINAIAGDNNELRRRISNL